MVTDQLYYRYYIEYVKKILGVTTIGFYLIKRIRRWGTDMYFRPTHIKDWNKKENLFKE